MLDLLIAPVFDRVYYFLEQPLTGTDDIQQHSELCRAYFSLLLSISSAAMQDVLISSRECLLKIVAHRCTATTDTPQPGNPIQAMPPASRTFLTAFPTT